GRRGAGETVQLVFAFQLRGDDDALPQDLAALAIEAKQHALLLVLQAAGEEDALPPDHGGRVADSGNRRLPGDVLRLAPVERDARLLRSAVAAWPAPAGPFLGESGSGQKEQGKRKEQRSPRHLNPSSRKPAPCRARRGKPCRPLR